MPQIPLHERLSELEQGEDETRAAFMARAAGISAEYDDVYLTPNDLEVVRDLLPLWRFEPHRMIQGQRYGLAMQYDTWAMTDQRKVLDGYRTDRRWVDVQSNRFVVLAKTALNGGDLAVVFTIDGATTNGKTLRQQRLSAMHIFGLSNNNKADDVYPDQPEPEVKEPETESVLSLKNGEAEVLMLLGWPVARIAETEKISESAVRHRLVAARKRNGMDLQQLLDIARDEGRIDLSRLPERCKYSLTNMERKLLRDHPFSELKVAADALGVTTRKISSLWTGIYVKTGLNGEVFKGKPVPPTRIRAYLIVKRDGKVR